MHSLLGHSSWKPVQRQDWTLTRPSSVSHPFSSLWLSHYLNTTGVAKALAAAEVQTSPPAQTAKQRCLICWNTKMCGNQITNSKNTKLRFRELPVSLRMEDGEELQDEEQEILLCWNKDCGCATAKHLTSTMCIKCGHLSLGHISRQKLSLITQVLEGTCLTPLEPWSNSQLLPLCHQESMRFLGYKWTSFE